jgi:hypothetical protein
MKPQNFDGYLNDIYGTVGGRNLKKVAARLRSGPNSVFLRSLIRRYFIKELTEDNYDRCFRFEICDGEARIVLAISVVAPVYLLLVVEPDDRITFPPESSNSAPTVCSLRSILHENGLDEVDRTLLKDAVNVPCYSAENPNLYNALFSDEPNVGPFHDLMTSV